MTHITCTRRLEFDAAHRVKLHESKCKYVHGHRYVVEITMSAPRLDAVGRVIDFGVMKEKLGRWLDENWDHTTLLWEEDRELGEAIAAQTGQQIAYMPNNPTAENIAAYLLEVVCPALFDAPLKVESIIVQETPNCRAEARVW